MALLTDTTEGYKTNPEVVCSESPVLRVPGACCSCWTGKGSCYLFCIEPGPAAAAATATATIMDRASMEPVVQKRHSQVQSVLCDKTMPPVSMRYVSISLAFSPGLWRESSHQGLWGLRRRENKADGEVRVWEDARSV